MPVFDCEDLGDASKKVSWILFAVASLTFAARVCCRLRYSPRHGGGLFIDDYITLVCLLPLLLFSILVTVAANYGVGRHYNTLSAVDKLESLKWNAVLGAVTPWICSLPKFAILSTLQRILNTGRRTAQMFWALALTSQALVVSLTILGLAQCTPLAYNWDKSITGGRCIDPTIYGRLGYVTYVFSTILDVFFALYPVPFVLRLKMPLAPRLGVAFALSVSWVGVAISCYKFSIMDKLMGMAATDPSSEGSFLIISTSLATLRPLLHGVKQQWKTVQRSACGIRSHAFLQYPGATFQRVADTSEKHPREAMAPTNFGSESGTTADDTQVLVERPGGSPDSGSVESPSEPGVTVEGPACAEKSTYVPSFLPPA